MDTSGLATSLSLAAFLLVFAYLSLVEGAISPRNTLARSSDHFTRVSLVIRALRLSAVAAAVLSAQALILGQGANSIWVIATVALGLLAFMALTSQAAKELNKTYPQAAWLLAFPFRGILRSARRQEGVGIDVGTFNGLDHGENGADSESAAAVVITEEEQAELDPRERLMIRSILRLDESAAREIMVPRVDIIAVDSDSPLTEVASKILESGHSRLPVYTDTIDNVIGVVYSRDLLPFLGDKEGYPKLEAVIRPAFFIPESKRLDELLKELQEKRVQMALVVDEYGGIEGLVTLEDLLEEIVGEIEDEFSHTHEPRVVPLANGDVIVDARVSLDYLSDVFSTPIDSDGIDTVGGLVYATLGKIPQVGDNIVYDGLNIEVVSLLGRRLRKLKLSNTSG